MATATISAARKGNIPLKIVSRGTSSAIPLMTYTFTPTGGVITPISVTRTIITPNHIGSKPRTNHWVDNGNGKGNQSQSIHKAAAGKVQKDDEPHNSRWGERKPAYPLR